MGRHTTKKGKKMTKFDFVIICCIIIVAFILFSVLNGPELLDESKFCSNETPKGYTLTSAYKIEKTISCGYETTKETDYDFCVKDFMRTQNHGIIKISDTCE